MKTEKTVKRYGRMIFSELPQNATAVRITAPNGDAETVRVFVRQPAIFACDEHGYERVSANGAPILEARYTPEAIGVYAFSVLCGDAESVSGTFEALPSEDHGFVQVSRKDPRYFAFSDGTPFVPLGLNMTYPTAYPASAKTEFALSGGKEYLGVRQYERWFRKLSESGGRFARLWVGCDYFTPDTGDVDAPDLLQMEKLDRVVEAARKYGIYLKLTFEHFRFFNRPDDTAPIFNKELHQGDAVCADMMQFLTEPRWHEAWLRKIGLFTDRFGNDPIIFAFEFWNEMNCVRGVPRETLNLWNRNTVEKLRPLARKNLWTNSLGSMDCEWMHEYYREFAWDAFDFVQFHRYLDQGAQDAICAEPPLAAQDGIARLVPFRKPILLAETGAVNDCHSGEFRYYSADDRGRIFVDTVYPAFFCGAAAPGHIWHWDARYVESKNLYGMLRPMAKLLDGVDADGEGFVCEDASTEAAYCFILRGRKTVLAFLRNRSDGWMNTLRDGNEPEAAEGICLPKIGAAKMLPIWPDEPAVLAPCAAGICVDQLLYGVLIKGANLQ